MTRFLALNLSVSEDGFLAGPNQSQTAPLGENGELLHHWAFVTQAFKAWHGEDGGTVGIDNDFIQKGFANIGATVMGRNMFGPVRGPWLNEDWKGWWGPKPGYGHPVFVLTHHERPPLDMGNGTVFDFITGGVSQARELAMKAANGRDVRVGGGARTVQQFLELKLLDELHIARVSKPLGAGELLISNPDTQLNGYRRLPDVPSDSVVHERYVRI